MYILYSTLKERESQVCSLQSTSETKEEQHQLPDWAEVTSSSSSREHSYWVIVSVVRNILPWKTLHDSSVKFSWVLLTNSPLVLSFSRSGPTRRSPGGSGPAAAWCSPPRDGPRWCSDSHCAADLLLLLVLLLLVLPWVSQCWGDDNTREGLTCHIICYNIMLYI